MPSSPSKSEKSHTFSPAVRRCIGKGSLHSGVTSTADHYFSFLAWAQHCLAGIKLETWSKTSRTVLYCCFLSDQCSVSGSGSMCFGGSAHSLLVLEHLKFLFVIVPICFPNWLVLKGGGEGNLSRLAGSYRERMVEIIPVSYLHPLITPLLTSLQIVTLKFLLKTIMNNRICN